MTEHRINYRFCSLLTLPLALALAACTFPKILGDDPTEGGSSGSSGGTTDGPVTTGEPVVCDQNPMFLCSQPVDCAQWGCGAPGDSFDANGCLRKSCTLEPCGEGEICFSVSMNENCAVVGCVEEFGMCSCGYSAECTANFCIPADEGPPVECAKITDKEACLAAGCSEFVDSLTRYATNENGECVVDSVGPACLWFPGDAWGGNATPGSFYEEATGLAVQFATDWIVPPHGWGDCGDADAPAACACFGMCASAQSAAAAFLEMDLPCADVSDCVLAEAICFEGNVCGTVGVHKDSVDQWTSLHSELSGETCCSGGNACGSSLACENQRCVAVFP